MLLVIYAIGILLAVVMASFLPLSGERRRYAVCHGAAALSYADVQGHLPPYVGEGAQYLRKMGGIIMVASIVIWALGYYPNHDEYESVTEQQENSYIGRIGKPWNRSSNRWDSTGSWASASFRRGRQGAGGKHARVLYADDAEADAVSLGERIPITPLVAFGYMVFVLIYFPCIATLAVFMMNSH